MDKKKEGIYRKSKYESRLINATGEIKPKVDFEPFHEDDYTQSVFGRWHEMGYNSGLRMMVFIQCCCVADVAGGKSGLGCSCFLVGDLIRRMTSLWPRMSVVKIRQMVKSLKDDGFIIHDEESGVRGRYMVNPVYAVNGRILERNYKSIKEKYSKQNER